jgi:hypothetical protein
MKYYKMETKGFVAEEIIHHMFPEGKPGAKVALPAGLQKHVDKIMANQGRTTWGQRYKDLENSREKLKAGSISSNL